VRERVTRYYSELQKVAWADSVRQETLKKDGTPKHKPEEFAFDSIVKLQQPAAEDTAVPFYVREVNELRIRRGKPVKKGTVIEPTDPGYLGIGAIAFLMLNDSRRDNYTFAYAGQGDLEGRRTVVLNVTTPQKTTPRVEFDNKFVGFGIRYHFEIFNVQYTKGRIWVDADTYDVVRMEWRSDPFNFEYKRDTYTHERAMTLRFHSVSFENSGQKVLVPESSEFVTTITGIDAPTHRTFHSFGNYKRFAGDVKVTPLGEANRVEPGMD
jgi:hypothetical protein